MKRSIYTVLLLLAFCQLSFAGAGYYITIFNESNKTFHATGQGGSGNKCWESGMLNNDNLISPQSSTRIYTEAVNSGTCNPFFYILSGMDIEGYQSFVLYDDNRENEHKFQLHFYNSIQRSKDTWLIDEVTGITWPKLNYDPFWGQYCVEIYLQKNGSINYPKIKSYLC